jgi:MFS family permease
VNTKKQAWAVLAAVFLAGVAVSLNQFKVPPVLPVLMPELGADMATGGWLMSVVSLAALVLAIPTAYLLARFGLRITGLVALSFTLAGSVIGGLSSGAAALLLGRTVEGVGMGLILVLGPTAVSAWFAPQERGLPMGIWAMWVPVGNAIAFNVAEPIIETWGWQALWWLGALCALAAAPIYAAVVVDPPGSPAQTTAPALVHSRQGSPTAPGTFHRHLLNPASWILGLAFGTFTFSMLGFVTWAPTYLSGAVGMPAATANFVASLVFLVGLGANLFAGWTIDRTRDRYRLLVLSFVIGTVFFSSSFGLRSVTLVTPYVLLLGTMASFIVTNIFTLAPDTMDLPQLAGLGVAIASVGSSLGTLTGPPVLGALISSGGWTAGSICLAIVMAVGSCATFVAWRKGRSPANP